MKLKYSGSFVFMAVAIILGILVPADYFIVFLAYISMILTSIWIEK